MNRDYLLLHNMRKDIDKLNLIIDQTIDLVKNILDKNAISLQDKEEIKSIYNEVKNLGVEINKNIN